MDIAEYNGSIGLPVPSTDACIKDEEGRHLPIGEVGELCIKGPQVMKGYWNRPDETANVMDAEGWLHTGDMARMDEKGFFYIVDRSEEHTSELQSLMRNSYAVFCLKTKNKINNHKQQ